MLSSPSDFALPDSFIGVGVGRFVQANSFLQYPGRKVASSAFQGPEPVSLSKYLTEGDSPWTGFQTPRGGHIPLTIQESNLNFSSYRSQPQSEIGSFTTTLCASDSGYGSQPGAPQSVTSGEYSSQSPEDSLYSDFDNFALASPMPELAASPPEAEDLETTKSTQRSRGGGKRKCDKCNEILKCPSDYRKHMLKHDKPNKCDVPGCSRLDGFSTINDLLRHKKSKHGIGLDTITTSFKCASSSCKNQAKIWPRRDNFKQHILRMHKDEDVNALISRSEIKSGTSSDGASMDADLAGISRPYAEPQPSTVCPEELDLDNSETFETGDDPWLPLNLSGGHLAHRFSALPARHRHNSENFVDYSGFDNGRGNDASMEPLDTLAAVSEFHPTIDANRTVSSRGYGHTSNTTSHLTSVNGQMVSNSMDAQQEGSKDPVFRAMLARFDFDNASNEKRRKILQLLNSDGLSGGIEDDEETSESSNGSQESQNLYPCLKSGCHKSFVKKTALTKHMKRHTKPWACTHFGCNKTFGSKDDWKRHERNQVPSAEVWICQLPDLDPTSSTPCHIREYDRAEFQEHLREDHGLTSRHDIDDMTLESKIGYSHQWSNAYYQVNFWCGFCKKIIQASHDPHKPVLPGKGADDNDASNHRWDHIGAHFDKGKLKMDQWTYWECPEKIGNLTDVKFIRDAYDGKVNPRKEERKREKQTEEWRKTQGDAELDVGRKRKAGEDLLISQRNSKKKKSVTVEPIYWNCCECGNGPISIQNHASCPEKCGHQRCDSCEGNYARDGGEEAAILRGPYDSWGADGRTSPTGSEGTIVGSEYGGMGMDITLMAGMSVRV
ncbi:C2H2 type zinc finger domain protein [Venturia nashicola]|uniref:C2H2 type zinc finger domain protein n=1 Tax=Venturia nashicola TaxID=86259 RepID=A0A4Z1NLC2_9PEZI|nr:C2H2 type zinc finger domain protein [Venturia nashicola]